NRSKQPIVVPISDNKPKQTVNQSVATPLMRTVAAKSTHQKPRSTIRKQYEQISKTCRWWYSKLTPPGYTWKPKCNTVNVKENVSTVKFENDQIAPILGYGDLVQGNITIKRVYYVEGLNYNLFSVGQFCDADLEVAFRKSTSTSSQAWLWHRRLSHLNFDSINLLLKNDIVIGLPKLKVVKDHLCSSYELGKAKRKRLHAQVRTVHTDKGTKFLNKTLHAYFAQEGIEHQTSTARTPEQNGVVESWNRTLVEAARTILSTAKVPLFFGLKDGENLDRMKEKGDACIFVRYYTQSRAYRVYNKRTIVIVETIHVNFEELPQMASDHVSSDPVPQCLTTTLKKFSLSPGPQSQENVPQPAETSSVVNAIDAPEKCQQKNTTSSTSTTVAADIPQLNIQKTPETTSQAPTQAPTITINENIIQAETNKEHAQVDEDEFINIFSTPNKTLARKDGEMCMFALTVSQTEPKNIKESMADYTWIEAMLEELHQFDRLDVLVDIPLFKNVINMK
ncbi:retrovirus-related pol polyprotein from transposon TNT 1-94, partial [Tanacetum coccineum]